MVKAGASSHNKARLTLEFPTEVHEMMDKMIGEGIAVTKTEIIKRAIKLFNTLSHDGDEVVTSTIVKKGGKEFIVIL